MIRNLAIAALRAAHRVKRSAALIIVPHFISSIRGSLSLRRASGNFHMRSLSERNKGLLGLSLNQFLPLVYSRPRFNAELSRCHKSLLFLRCRSCCVMTYQGYLHLIQNGMPPPGGVLGLIFVGYVLLAPQRPYPILVAFGQICNFPDPNLVTFLFYVSTLSIL